MSGCNNVLAVAIHDPGCFDYRYQRHGTSTIIMSDGWRTNGETAGFISRALVLTILRGFMHAVVVKKKKCR